MQLSRNFSALVRANFTKSELAEINKRNQSERYKSIGACATHDFIDANSLMYGAFCALYFREPDPASQDDANVMNQAWDMSKRNQFKDSTNV